MTRSESPCSVHPDHGSEGAGDTAGIIVAAIPCAPATAAFVVDTAHTLRYAPTNDQPEFGPAMQGGHADPLLDIVLMRNPDELSYSLSQWPRR